MKGGAARGFLGQLAGGVAAAGGAAMVTRGAERGWGDDHVKEDA